MRVCVCVYECWSTRASRSWLNNCIRAKNSLLLYPFRGRGWGWPPAQHFFHNYRAQTCGYILNAGRKFPSCGLNKRSLNINNTTQRFSHPNNRVDNLTRLYTHVWTLHRAICLPLNSDHRFLKHNRTNKRFLCTIIRSMKRADIIVIDNN